MQMPRWKTLLRCSSILEYVLNHSTADHRERTLPGPAEGMYMNQSLFSSHCSSESELRAHNWLALEFHSMFLNQALVSIFVNQLAFRILSDLTSSFSNNVLTILVQVGLLSNAV